MSLKRTYLLGLVLSTAFVYACESSEDPNYVDSGSPAVPGTPSGVGGNAAGTGGTMGGTTVPPTNPTGMAGGLSGLGGLLDSGILGGPGNLGGSPLGGTGTDAGVPGGGGDGGTGTGEGGTSTPIAGGTCPGLPATTDYAAKGPFDVMMKADVVAGSEGCTLFRPGTSLGKDGLKHPIAVWGNGILTTPDQYQKLLGHIVSHGFVVVACNSSMPERPCLDMCMEWLIKQNASGEMAGKLDLTKEATIGYSWGGGAAINTSTRPNVKATVSFHGMPPRDPQPWSMMKAPLLLFTSTGDSFVSAEQYVTPNYNNSKVPTYYATLQEAVGHVYPCDEGSACESVGGIAFGGPATGAIKEQAGAIAWLRYWACDDQNAKKYFFGANAELGKAPFKSQSKPAGAFQ
jgi:hypothetical protein